MSDSLTAHVDKFIFTVLTDRLYTQEDLWVLESGGRARLGLSDYAQQRAGDIAFVSLIPTGTRVSTGDFLGTVETIKVNLDLYSPVEGILTLTNPLLHTAPEIINQDSYGQGWLCEIELSDWESSRLNLLEPQAYFVKMEREAREEAEKNV